MFEVRVMASSLVLRHKLMSKLMRTGAILCKFCSGESEIRHLGRYLRDKTTASFQPHFTIAEDSRSTTEKKKIEISQRIISHMTKQADFRLDDIIINVSGEEVITDIDLSIVSGHKFPISGFPRALLQKSPKSRRLFKRHLFVLFFKCLFYTLT